MACDVVGLLADVNSAGSKVSVSAWAPLRVKPTTVSLPKPFAKLRSCPTDFGPVASVTVSTLWNGRAQPAPPDVATPSAPAQSVSVVATPALVAARVRLPEPFLFS